MNIQFTQMAWSGGIIQMIDVIDRLQLSIPISNFFLSSRPPVSFESSPATCKRILTPFSTALSPPPRNSHRGGGKVPHLSFSSHMKLICGYTKCGVFVDGARADVVVIGNIGLRILSAVTKENKKSFQAFKLQASNFTLHCFIFRPSGIWCQGCEI